VLPARMSISTDVGGAKQVAFRPTAWQHGRREYIPQHSSRSSPPASGPVGWTPCLGDLGVLNSAYDIVIAQTPCGEDVRARDQNC